MEKAIKKILQQWNRLSQREAVAVIAGLIAALFIVWNVVIYSPYRENSALLQQDIMQTDAKIAVAEAKFTVLQADLNRDPDRENRILLEQYIEESKKLDAELAQASVQIIDVRDMVVLLKNMLEQQTSLKFVSLENRPATPEFIEKTRVDDGEQLESEAITIYRHSVVLKMEGSYSSLLSYLQALEKMQWQYFWQKIEIETETYPNALITLEVYTLGLREGLIGV